ncbi:unnamed protein product [Phytomonas sp. EM1]|nr:unnamed protein product [Phytomonas sp. EM1]|eukprot:CCW62400.1 unnamed protein product [Phytomonas sp. isolate EM1]
MDCQSLLDGLAKERGLSLTPLARMCKYPRSRKIVCCGGLVVRVESESSADSTVCIQDGSGLCFCAIHGDITSRYPDVLSTGAVLLFHDVTLLVTGGRMPPLLIVCLENLFGLLLPDVPEQPLAPPKALEQSMDIDSKNATPQDQMCGTEDAALGDSARRKQCATYLAAATTSPLGGSGIPQTKGPERLAHTNDPRQTGLFGMHEPVVYDDDDENCLELVDDL